jgi:hypothetical protein
MFKRNIILYFVVAVLSCSCAGTAGRKDKTGEAVTFVQDKDNNCINVLTGGKLFTSFRWPVDVYKPILYPVYTSAGTEVTRGFPLSPRPGERDDHMHQVGIWFTYGNVNGIDFWGNGYRGFKEPDGGVIKHIDVDTTIEGDGEGVLISGESWIIPSGDELIAEKTQYHFIAFDSLRIIERITTLTTGDSTVFFKDTKEGMFGIRVARQLELPTSEMITVIDSSGNPSEEKIPASTGVTGNYHSSEGIQGKQVWGTRARWMALDGKIGDEKVTIAIFDHPDNPGFPTYWHAREYGLFAANPFGATDFTSGKEISGFSIPAHLSVTFRYSVIINSGSWLPDNNINSLYEQFVAKYEK